MKISLTKSKTRTDLSLPAITGVNPALKAREKKPFNFQEFINSFNSLDPANMGNWPTPVKVTILIFIMILTLALTYFGLISGVQDEIAGAATQEETLLKDYQDKDSKLRNLKLYEIQIQEMENTFGQLLQQLPKEHEISNLIEEINYTGVGSGVQFADIKVEPELKQEFFIELPITIVGKGDYHAFGNFVSGLAALPRIVTMHDFEIAPNNADKAGEIPVLQMTMHAKTYRYNDQAEDDKAKKDKDKKDKPAAPATEGAKS